MKIQYMKMRKLIIFLLPIFLLGCVKEKAKDENSIRVRAVKDVATLNPITYGGMIEARIIFELVYQSLLTIDMEDNEIKPVLAESLPLIEVNDSVSFFSYTIRDEAVWPNGDPITASDVLFTLKATNCPLINNEKERMSLDFIQNMEVSASDAKEFTFKCEGYVEDMTVMTGGIYILPEYKYDPAGLLKKYSFTEIKEGYESLKNDPAIQDFAKQFNLISASHEPNAFEGSAGYVLTAWQTDQYVALQKKSEWWAEDLNLSHITANPDKIIYQIIPDDAAATLALKNGQLDVMRDIPANEFLALSKDSSFLKQYNLFSPFTYAVNYIGINSRSPKFQGKKTRQAFAHILNVEDMIESIGQSPKSRSNSLISPYAKKKYNNTIAPFPFDLEKAQRLLQEDGWVYENGGWYKIVFGKKEQLSGSIQYKAGKGDYENIALIFKQSAEKIGIPIEVNPVENSVLSGNLRQHKFDFYIRSLIGNPFAFNFTPILHTQSSGLTGMNYTAFGTPASDSLIESIISEKDKKKQALQIKEFQEILHDEGNLLFLYFDEQKIAVHNRFENLKISGLYPNYDISAFKTKE